MKPVQGSQCQPCSCYRNLDTGQKQHAVSIGRMAPTLRNEQEHRSSRTFCCFVAPWPLWALHLHPQNGAVLRDRLSNVPPASISECQLR